MARKSKGKFTMKGCSPFKIENEDRTKLDAIDIETPDQDANKAAPQAEGQSEIDFMVGELAKMRNRLKEQKIKNPSETLEEQKNKYSLDDGLNEDSAINKPIQKFDPLAKDKIKYGNTDRISNLKIK